MSFEFPKRIDLARVPTRIEKLKKVSNYFEGPQIYVKRDDFTGVATTGNKIRKLEFLLADAVEQNCDCVITCGSYNSNHARATAVAAAKVGLKCHLVLRDGMRAPMEGNLFLDRLVGAEVEYVTHEEYKQIDGIMQEVAERFHSEGHNPYIIPEGGSNEIGSLGYVKAAEEIAQQLKSMKLQIHHIVTAVGSGGTYAGLLLGKFLYDLPMQFHGINVCDDAAFFTKKIDSLLKKIQKRFDLDLPISKKDLSIIDGYVGKGFGLSSQEEIDLIKQIAQTEGLILDPVYTGKAMLGLKDQIRQGRFKPDENLLFVHTGGIFGLFAKKSLFF
ncbi:D-cysteine desulfhydrase family protein [candidate division KSB1 bacterium]|nr:D-cysteine desulfhydrase family protein [candidate division KSB1 bacterium]NIR72568.1 D-cysteine desulfhydrase family protein [candidate division KSB1 bacterium]NIS27320.1 D-cysteine desulfhydrase family protein [candidate division KSB1 bacterium]NIT73530.1 D-cysteine desulfhydrase family protein [candidate division KSB1 bacterium]NIU28050.1 D-cysteine desulfhydrase family protein [candidate division KSB1 bacterium]